MVSSSLSHLLERVRVGFGLEVEVLDAALHHLYPEAATALALMIEESPELRQSLLDALADGRQEQLENAGGPYQVFPLRAPNRQATALVAVRRAERGGVLLDDEKAWSELARAVVEADFAAADALTSERQHSRRLLAALRFLCHLVETDDEGELGNAILQAAAVWFDADARIFQRDLAGEFQLHAALPGAHIEDGARQLNSLWLAGTHDVVRLGAISEWGELASGGEIVLVPLSVTEQPEWVLVLIGRFPQEAESLLAVLGRVAGAQLAMIRARRRERIRDHFETLTAEGGGPEVAARLVRDLIGMTGASHGSLILNGSDSERRPVGIGETSESATDRRVSSGLSQFAPTEFVCPMPRRDGTSATLVLRPAPGDSLTPNAELVTRVVARVLQCWLVGAEPSLTDLAVSA